MSHVKRYSYVSNNFFSFLKKLWESFSSLSFFWKTSNKFAIPILLLISFCSSVWSFYVPGIAPVEWRKGQKIDVKAVKMTSTHTQLPYEYYSLQFCLPKNGTLIYKSENLGEVLRGDRIVSSFLINSCHWVVSIVYFLVNGWFSSEILGKENICACILTQLKQI